MKNLDRVMWGLVLIGIGFVMGLNTLGVIDFDLFFSGWWTLFIIIPAFVGLFGKSSKTANIIWLIIGVLTLLVCQEVIDFRVAWRLIVPIILVILGFSFIFKNTIGTKIKDKIKEINKNSKNTKEYVAVFSGQKLNFEDEEFEGCSLTAVFGGIDLNLKNSKLKKDVVVSATSIFGETKIIAPDDVNVKVNSSSIFGGVNNRVKYNKENKVTIYVDAKCMFGGVEVK